MKSDVFKCDGCKTERAFVNHWLLVFTGGNIVGIKGFIVYPWDDELALSPDAQHFCGDTCSLKAFADWLSKIRTAPSAEVSQVEASLGRSGLMETKGLPV